MMKRFLLLMCVLLVTSAVSQASILIDPAGSAKQMTKWITVSDPATDFPSFSNDGWTSGTTVTGPATGGSGSFTLTWTGYNGWDASSAQTALSDGTFAGYLAGLTAQDLASLAGGDIGVESADTPNAKSKVMDAGEVLVITVDTDFLSGDLILEGLTFGNSNANDYMDFLVYDSSANTMLQADWDVKVENIAGLAYTLETGDQVLIAGQSRMKDDGSMDWFRVSKYTVDVVPEPATLALLGFGGLALLKRRR